MRMRGVVHATTVFHLHRSHTASGVQGRRRMRVERPAAGRRRAAIIKLGRRAHRAGGRRSGQVPLILKHALAEHLVLLLGDGRSAGRPSPSAAIQTVGAAIAIVVMSVFRPNNDKKKRTSFIRVIGSCNFVNWNLPGVFHAVGRAGGEHRTGSGDGGRRVRVARVGRVDPVALRDGRPSLGAHRADGAVARRVNRRARDDRRDDGGGSGVRSSHAYAVIHCLVVQQTRCVHCYISKENRND